MRDEIVSVFTGCNIFYAQVLGRVLKVFHVSTEDVGTLLLVQCNNSMVFPGPGCRGKEQQGNHNEMDYGYEAWRGPPIVFGEKHDSSLAELNSKLSQNVWQKVKLQVVVIHAEIHSM